jgi:hypothetical protein
MKLKVFILVALLGLAMFTGGCSWLDSFSTIVGMSDTATVITKTAQIRTSYAIVAADLLEVKRGDRLDVLDQTDFEKVLWYRVRAHDEAKTEGWIEAQNVITNDVLEKSKKLADDFKNQPPQASGQLRAATNLRLAPDMSPDNVLYKLATASTFEIVAWKYVPKQDVTVDDSAKSDQKQSKNSKNDDVEAAKDDDEPDKLDDKYDMWYEVRLDPSVSPAPAGWIFGRQVDLKVPSDIVFFQQNSKKYVAWQRLDTDAQDKVDASAKKTPGSWVVLSRSNTVKAIDGVEPDFDGIQVLAFDQYDQSYYTAWRTNGDVWGQLPLKVEGQGDNKAFTMQLRGADGKMVEKRFVVFRDKNRLKITPPEDIAQFQTKSK